MAWLDLTRYDAAVAKMMALMGMDGAGETMSADMDTSPQYYTMKPGSTLDVTTVPMGELKPRVYQLNQDGATYTITGKRATSSSTTLRFVISANCTVILKGTEFKAGITYDDGTKNHYRGGTHGVFEVEQGKIGQNIEIINKNPGTYGVGYVIMKGGSVSIDGFGNTYGMDYHTPKGTVLFSYQGGNFRNTYDFKENSEHLYTTPDGRSTMYRVEIPIQRFAKGKIKVGSTGTFTEFEAWSDSVLYAWQDSAAVRDYYVVYNGKYYHYKSGTYAAGTYTAQADDAASEKDTIGGFSGTVRGSGKGIANAELIFVREGTDGMAYTGTCTTDSNGQYYVALPPGTYTVKLKFPTGELTYGEKFSLSEEKESNKDINVSAVSGTITDQNQNPLSGAEVTVQQGNNVFTTQTDAAGTYTIVPVGFTEDSFNIRVAYRTFKAVSGTSTWNHLSGSICDLSINTSSESEIHIENEADLLRLAKNVEHLSDKTIILENDITVSSGENGFKGIDHTGKKISNLTFKGNGHTISGMTRPLFHTNIDQKDTSKTNLNNCIFENLHIKGDIEIYRQSKESYYGVLCGMLSGGGSRVEGCSFEGSICIDKEARALGALVGKLAYSATIENSYANLSFIKAEYSLMGNSVHRIGGICGIITDNATIKNCYIIIADMQWGSSKDAPCVGVITGVCQSASIISNCYGVINKAKKNINLYGEQEKSIISGYISGDGAQTNSGYYITMEKVAAASGTEGALVDKLNTYVNNTSGLNGWSLTANGYPEFQSLNDVTAADVTVTYDGRPHSIEVNGVPNGKEVLGYILQAVH